MAEVLKALERREEVTIFYRGKAKGRILPVSAETGRKVADHPFFGMNRDDDDTVETVVDRLRESRVRDI